MKKYCPNCRSNIKRLPRCGAAYSQFGLLSLKSEPYFNFFCTDCHHEWQERDAGMKKPIFFWERSEKTKVLDNVQFRRDIQFGIITNSDTFLFYDKDDIGLLHKESSKVQVRKNGCILLFGIDYTVDQDCIVLNSKNNYTSEYILTITEVVIEKHRVSKTKTNKEKQVTTKRQVLNFEDKVCGVCDVVRSKSYSTRREIEKVLKVNLKRRN